LLLNNGISALPVLDHAGALVGIISEGDLMRRVEPSAEHRRSCGLRFFREKAARLSRRITSSHMRAELKI
jgi:CBS-domain-containing membrane protein